MDRYMLFPSGMGQHQNGSYVLFADAQATIAALQAQLHEQSEKLKYHDLFKKWQCWRDPDELVDEYEKWQAAIQEHQSLKDQLTQRTAELEAVSNFIGVQYDAESRTWVSGQAPYQSAGTTKQEACIAAVDALRLACATWETKYRDLQAELERVRGELAETKEEVKCLDEQVSALNQGCLEYERLIAALPKVEGEIVTRQTPDGVDVTGYTEQGDFSPHIATFKEADHAERYVALLQHRQGMEG